MRDGRGAVGRGGCHSGGSPGRAIAVHAAPACVGGEAGRGGAESAGGDGARVAHPGDERARSAADFQGTGGRGASAPAQAALWSVWPTRARLRHEARAPVATPGVGTNHLLAALRPAPRVLPRAWGESRAGALGRARLELHAGLRGSGGLAGATPGQVKTSLSDFGSILPCLPGTCPSSSALLATLSGPVLWQRAQPMLRGALTQQVYWSAAY